MGLRGWLTGRAEPSQERRTDKVIDDAWIRPLGEAAKRRFAAQWDAIAARFVEDPQEAAANADGMIVHVLAEMGCPLREDADTTDAEAGLVSADRPDVVFRYRHGQELLVLDDPYDAVRTENLRKAMIDFHAVVEELLETEARAA